MDNKLFVTMGGKFKDIDDVILKENDLWEFLNVRYILKYINNKWWFIREDGKGTNDDWISATYSSEGSICMSEARG